MGTLHDFLIEAKAPAFLPQRTPPALAGEEVADDARASNRVAPMGIPRVLLISGSDSGGGAGLQADVKACAALGCFSGNAVSALTAQNTLGVHGVFGVPPEFVVAQMDAVLGDIARR